MNTLKDELAKALSGDEVIVADEFQKFIATHVGSLPLPGEDSKTDRLMWAAAEHGTLLASDEVILKRVVDKFIVNEMETLQSSVLRLKDLIGQGKEAAIQTWREMLAAMSWQQMIPAGSLRGIGTQMVSLGTFQKQLANANIQVNIGWLVDQEHLRVLLQAKDGDEEAIPNVELRIKEASRGIVFTRLTNEDGAVVAPHIHVGPGKYCIEVMCGDKVAETPYFVV